MSSRQDDDYVLIFRRYRRTRAGRVLDARKYGLKAWPLKIRRRRRKK